jgi:aromatic ring-opening dioxygenase LigB subunit
MIVSGAIVPHAPLLTIPLPAGDPVRDEMEAINHARDGLTFDSCDAAVILSPHGRAAGVYRDVRGSLDGFALKGRQVEASVHMEVAEELARAWGQPQIDDPVDHGITGALVGGAFVDIPVVAVTFPGVTGPKPAADVHSVIDAALRLATALEKVAERSTLAVIASAHTSAALTPRAPLMDRREGHDLDARILGALEGNLEDLTRIEPDLWEAGGSCGAAPLTTIGSLFAGGRGEVLSYGAPAGVGYLVARVFV